MSETIFKYELGGRAKDKISGLTGIIVARAQYLTGCTHYALCPEKVNAKNGIDDWTYLDESRIEILDEKAVDIEPPKEKPGGPTQDPPQA